MSNDIERKAFEKALDGEAHLKWIPEVGEYNSQITQKMWLTWQAARSQGMEYAELSEPMTEDFKAAWRNGLPLYSMEAKWAFVGWQAARAEGDCQGFLDSSDAKPFITLTIVEPEPGNLMIRKWRTHGSVSAGEYELYTHPTSSGGVPRGWSVWRDEVGYIRIDSPKDAHFSWKRDEHLADSHPMNMLADLAEALLTTQPTGGEWVRCEDRLPSKTGHYCIALADPDDIGWTTSVTWTAFWNGDDFEDCDPVEDGQPVTHWMPLPQPPQDREGGE